MLPSALFLTSPPHASNSPREIMQSSSTPSSRNRSSSPQSKPGVQVSHIATQNQSSTSRSPHPQQKSTEQTEYTKIFVQDLLNRDRNEEMRNSPQFQEVKCEYLDCGKLFASPQSMFNHQKRQHGSPTANVCPKCLSSFSTIPNLNKHVSLYQS